jgi:hypothetical protein
MTTLFDKVERVDDLPAWRDEDSFTFLNRAAGVVWQRQRDLLEAWYRDFPDEDGDLRARFRAKDPRQHYPGWWELYVHALFRCLGYTMTVHPSIPGTDARIDFLAAKGYEEFYIEAAAVFSGIVSPTRQAKALVDILAAIDRLDASEYYVSLRVDRVGISTPSLRTIRGAIVRWVNSLDHGDVEQSDPTDQSKWKEFSFGDWSLALRPHVWNRGSAVYPYRRFIGMQTGMGGMTDDVPRLQAAVTRKGRKYGDVDKPMIVAVLATNGFVDDRTITGALYGSEAIRVNVATGEAQATRNLDGVWVGRRGPVGRKISAVLTGVGISPGSVARFEPTLWHHFAPHRPLTAALPLRSARAVNNDVEFSDAAAPIASVFGLPAEWPGPEPAFPRPAQH